MTPETIQSLKREFADLDTRKEFLKVLHVLNSQEKDELADIRKRQQEIGKKIFNGSKTK